MFSAIFIAGPSIDSADCRDGADSISGRHPVFEGRKSGLWLSSFIRIICVFHTWIWRQKMLCAKIMNWNRIVPVCCRVSRYRKNVLRYIAIFFHCIAIYCFHYIFWFSKIQLIFQYLPSFWSLGKRIRIIYMHICLYKDLFQGCKYYRPAPSGLAIATRQELNKKWTFQSEKGKLAIYCDTHFVLR